MKTLHYVLSEKCNLNCSYCDVNVNDKHYHSNKDFDKFFESYINPLNEEYQFDIFGGEPFLHINEINHIIEALEKEDNCKKIRITSNATIYNQSVVKIIQHPKVVLTVSHDGAFMEMNRGIDYIKMGKMYFNQYNEACVAVGKRLKVHSMLTGNMFIQPLNSEPLIKHQLNTLNLMFIDYKNIDISFEIVRDKGSWTMYQAKEYIKSFKYYVDYLVDKIKYRDVDYLDPLYMSYASALIEASLNKNYQRPTCGVNTGKHQTFFNNKVIACERFDRYAPSHEYLYISSKFDELYSNCKKCPVEKLCNKGCIYETILNKKPIDEVCYIIKESFKIVQASFDEIGKEVIQYFYKGNK